MPAAFAFYLEDGGAAPALGFIAYLVFYVLRETHVDVWRVLHDRQDIPQWLQEPDET